MHAFNFVCVLTVLLDTLHFKIQLAVMFGLFGFSGFQHKSWAWLLKDVATFLTNGMATCVASFLKAWCIQFLERLFFYHAWRQPLLYMNFKFSTSKQTSSNLTQQINFHICRQLHATVSGVVAAWLVHRLFSCLERRSRSFFFEKQSILFILDSALHLNCKRKGTKTIADLSEKRRQHLKPASWLA